MTEIAGAVLGGLLLGFAGSFHCALMCGGIASGALFLLKPPTPAERMLQLARLNGGRILVYAVAGGVFAGTAGLTIGPNATAATYKVLQWSGAAVLMWVGLAMAGVVPRFALPERLGGLAAGGGRLVSASRLPLSLTPVAMGAAWGLTPCPMAYAALFSAMMTGSAAAGFAWMAGFGLGTLPGVLGATFGITWIANLRTSRWAEVVAGLAVAVFGLLTAFVSWPQVAAWCLPGH